MKTNHLACILVMALAGCKSLKDRQSWSIQPMPESYAGRSDSSSAATVHWREYFDDKYLVSLLDSALTNNLDIQTAFQRVEMATANVLLSKGALKPEVGAFVEASQRKFGLYTMDGAGNVDTEIYGDELVPTRLWDYNPGLYTVWEVDVWGRLRNQKRAALHRFLATVEGRNLVITSLIGQVAAAYYELRALDNQLTILDQNIKLQENAFELVKVQKEAGAANSLAVKQLEAQVFHSRGMRAEVLQEIVRVENEINLFLGRYPQPISRDTAVTHRSLAEVSLGMPGDLLQLRPDVRQAEFVLLASKADVGAAKAAFYPSLNIGGTIGFQAYRTNLLFNTPESFAYSLLGTLSAPLVNRAAIRSQFRMANARQLEALYNYHKTIVSAYTEVHNLVTAIRSLEDIHELKSREVHALTESIEVSGTLFRTGRATYLEVILAQQNALQAELELVEIRKRQQISTVNLYKALGGGWSGL